jgi:hypothetical protein
MSTTSQTAGEADTKFQHRVSNSAPECHCPVHRDRERDPFTAPLGKSFASQVSVEEISRDEALEIYREHHSYKSDLPDVNITHHGLYFQGNLLGAITYRFPLLARKKVYFDSNDDLAREPLSKRELESLPDPIQQRAADIFPRPEEAPVDSTEVFPGNAFITASRICIGVSMPNFASAALARSQVKFVEEYGAEFEDFQFLATYVRADFEGSMIKALRDKGWKRVGLSTPSRATNREQTAINERYKWVFFNSVEKIREQATLSDFSQTQ